ncbi:MAG: hypothetical protein ABSB26_00655 [Nitrososphaerales archaeon]
MYSLPVLGATLLYFDSTVAHMRVLVRMEDRKLAGCVQQSLEDLGFSFIKNQGRSLTEFEVRRPCHFIVTVENLAREQFGYPFRSPIRVESAIEVKPLIGSPEPENRLRETYSALFNHLRGKLHDEPWKGLGALASRHEKRIWESFGTP